MRIFIIAAIASLCAAPAAAHDPRECRTVLAQFEKHRKAFEESAAVIGPSLDRLSAAYDEADAVDSHAERHAAIYRQFVARYPVLRLHLAEATIATSEAVSAAARAIFCLRREKDSP